MYEYTEIESKYTGKIGGTQHVGTNVHNTLTHLNYAERSEAKKFLNLKKRNILFMLIITVQIFSLC